MSTDYYDYAAAQVPVGAVYDVGSTHGSADESSTPAARWWAYAFLCASAVAMLLAMVTTILFFVTFSLSASSVVLHLYILVMCFYAVTAELRQVPTLRPVIYAWMRPLYFLTRYRCRAFFYLVIASLLLDGIILHLVSAILAAALGVTMFVVSFWIELPVYRDLAAEQAQHDYWQMHFERTNGTEESLFAGQEKGMSRDDDAAAAVPLTVAPAAPSPAGAPRSTGDRPKAETDRREAFVPPGPGEGPNAL